ncbi:MAG: PAS domain S-box protein [Candidatus Riflebacteria bacterium]|nr:PAS domain S-box protein [Candidatus Riflebacteria bacterium]
MILGKQFFVDQLDFIFFLYGFAFFLLSAVCGLFLKNAKTPFPLFWLGLFGFIHGLNEWLDLVTMVLPDDPFNFAVTRFIIVFMSFLPLMEFGRQYFFPNHGRVKSSLFYLPFFLFLFTGIPNGLIALNAACRYSFAFPGALLAAFVFLFEAKGKKPRIFIPLVLTGLSMFFYSILTGFIVQKSQFYFADKINQDNFFQFFGAPVQLFRCCCVLVIAGCLLHYKNLIWRDTLGIPFQKSRFISHHWLLVALTTVILGGWILTETGGREENFRNKKTLQEKAKLASLALNPAEISNLKGSPEELKDPQYLSLYEKLKLIRENFPPSSILYILRKVDEKIVFLLSSDPLNPSNSLQPEGVYNERSDALKEVFKSGISSTEEPIILPNGWESTFVPIIDKDFQKVEAVLGVVIEANTWKKIIGQHRVVPILITFCIIMMIFAIYLIQSQQTEYQLNEGITSSENKIQKIFDSLNDPLLIQNLDGKISQVNEKLFNLFQINPSKVGELDFECDLSSPKNDFSAFKDFIQRVKNNENVVFEWKARCFQDKSEFDTEVAISKFTDGHQDFLLYNIRDITDRKKIENEIKMANQNLEKVVEERTLKLSEINKELESFCYSISHDLRAPLRSIDGFSQALIEDYYDQLDEQARDYINRMRGGCRRMNSLVEELLKLSKVSQDPLNLEIVNLSEMCSDILNELKNTSPLRSLKIQIAMDMTAFCDRGLIKIALYNLIGNSWKYSCKKETSEIKIGLETLDGKKRFFVRDNGVGFDMKFSHKLFGVFQRLHTNKDFEGLGAGLAIVQRIIRRHNGKVWGEGEVDKGACFYFTLPETIVIKG